MLNPDGVIYGNNRCCLAGVDLNRQWKKPIRALHPNVYYLKNFMKAQKGMRDVSMYIDLHGHSRKYNVFMYGCDDKKKPRPQVRAFPKFLSMHHIGRKYVSFADCSFHVKKGRDTTARVVVSKELNIPFSYTLEATFCGANYGPLKHCHMNIGHLQEVGSAMCDAILHFSISEGLVKDNLSIPNALSNGVLKMAPGLSTDLEEESIKFESEIRRVSSRESLSGSRKGSAMTDDDVAADELASDSEGSNAGDDDTDEDVANDNDNAVQVDSEREVLCFDDGDDSLSRVDGTMDTVQRTASASSSQSAKVASTSTNSSDSKRDVHTSIDRTKRSHTLGAGRTIKTSPSLQMDETELMSQSNSLHFVGGSKGKLDFPVVLGPTAAKSASSSVASSSVANSTLGVALGSAVSMTGISIGSSTSLRGSGYSASHGNRRHQPSDLDNAELNIYSGKSSNSRALAGAEGIQGLGVGVLMAPTENGNGIGIAGRIKMGSQSARAALSEQRRGDVEDFSVISSHSSSVTSDNSAVQRHNVGELSSPFAEHK